MDLLIFKRGLDPQRSWWEGRDLEWVLRHCPSDLLLADPTSPAPLDRIALVTDSGPFDPLTVKLADALATVADASIVILHAVPSDATNDRRATIAAYHETLMDLCTARAESRIVEGDLPTVVADATLADLMILEIDGSW